MSDNINELDRIFDEYYPEQINLKSFEEKDGLCPRIWDGEGRLKRLIRIRLWQIAMDFISNIDDMDIPVEDVVIVGSIAGYNWSKYSDIDLHIMVDFSALSDYAGPVVLKQNFDAKKNAWNEKHEILIYGYPVELYVQDVNDTNGTDGMYSVKYGRWLKIPKGGNELWDRTLIRTQSAQYLNQIDRFAVMAQECRSKTAARMILKEVEKVYDEIVKNRRYAIAADGEFAPMNIVFKVMRRTGAIQKMKDTKTLLYDKIRTLYRPAGQA